jgi:hypothetical protein
LAQTQTPPLPPDSTRLASTRLDFSLLGEDTETVYITYPASKLPPDTVGRHRLLPTSDD